MSETTVRGHLHDDVLKKHPWELTYVASNLTIYTRLSKLRNQAAFNNH